MKTRPTQKGDWNAEEISTLVALWPHMTSRQISERLTKLGYSRSRNAVIGQAYRMSLSKDAVDLPPPEPPKPKPEPKVNHRPRSNGLCTKFLGTAVVDGKRKPLHCHNTAQPGRGKCAEHLPKPKVKEGQFSSINTFAASSIGG